MRQCLDSSILYLLLTVVGFVVGVSVEDAEGVPVGTDVGDVVGAGVLQMPSRVVT